MPLFLDKRVECDQLTRSRGACGAVFTKTHVNVQLQWPVAQITVLEFLEGFIMETKLELETQKKRVWCKMACYFHF